MRETNLHTLTDDELLQRLADVLKQSRRVECILVAHIAEVDRRRLYAREGFPSMFQYCRDALHLSESEAYRRIAAARVSRKYPVILEMLEDGRIHLAAISELKAHLTDDNYKDVLTRATHKSKEEVKQLVDAAVSEKLETVEAKRYGKTNHPRKTTEQADTSSGSRYIPAPVKRAVCEHDRDQCTHVAPDGASASSSITTIRTLSAAVGTSTTSGSCARRTIPSRRSSTTARRRWTGSGLGSPAQRTGRSTTELPESASIRPVPQ